MIHLHTIHQHHVELVEYNEIHRNRKKFDGRLNDGCYFERLLERYPQYPLLNKREFSFEYRRVGLLTIRSFLHGGVDGYEEEDGND